MFSVSPGPIRGLISIKLLPWIWHFQAWMLVPVRVAFENSGPFLGEVHIHGFLALRFAVNFPSKILLFSGPHFLSLPGYFRERETASFLLPVTACSQERLLYTSLTAS